MTDRNIDIDLIMALVEGSLPPEEAHAAEASLDDDARAELAEQRLARALITDIAPAAMTERERLDMRAAVRSELNLDATPAAPVVAPKTPWYWKALPALGAAAAMVLVVGIGLANLGIGGGSDSEATSEESATAATDAPSSLDDSMLTGSADMAEAPQLESAPEETAAAATEATTAMTESTEAAAEEAADGAFRAMMVPDKLGEIDLDDLDQLAATVDEGAQRIIGFAPYAYFELDEAASEPGLRCWDELLDLETPDSLIDYLGEAILGEADAEVYRAVAPDGTQTIYVFVGEECATAAIVMP